MKPVRSFHVHPSLPARLEVLEDLAFNLRWSWDHETIALFRRMDRDLWEKSFHNPVRMLGTIAQDRLEELAVDEAFLAHMDRVAGWLERYRDAGSTWYGKAFPSVHRPLAAYFSMEFGLTECLRIYSGGLGVLAGDHIKSASDLGVPIVGVGLLYQKGYFRQYLNVEGWQQETYPINDFHTLPIRPFLDAGGCPVRFPLNLAGRDVVVQLWRVEVGRVTLILLDTNLPENPQDLQDIADELYGGDLETRIQQECVLGIGGVRALEVLGLRPWVYHMNEGHCAFLSLERMRSLMQEKALSYRVANELVSSSTIFTTHTPVPAGIDIFPSDLVRRYLGKHAEDLGIGDEGLLELGRMGGRNPDVLFNMAVLALRTTCFVNGVSRLHGEVARKMWKGMWPSISTEESPIVHVTNGIHPGSWISKEMKDLFDRYLGPGWSEEPTDSGVWKRSEQIPGEELWRTHERRRERLVAFTRRRMAEQLRRRGVSKQEIGEAENVLDPEALTIGFARRFASYKRATLLLKDPVRLAGILNRENRPVQVIFAGKAHPRDDTGKELIRQIVQLASRPEFRKRIVFLENYDAVISRYLVQGVDVWLNTPRRPMEASGTSGMKALFNGALNLSIPDGWWDEARSPRAGWTIGQGEDYTDLEYQDRVESAALYEILEREIVPLFYKRSGDGLPGDWIEMMRAAMCDLCPEFNTNRMVQEYTTLGYQPARDRTALLESDGHHRARALAGWKDRIRSEWRNVKILEVEADLPERVQVGAECGVRARIRSGTLGPADLRVQALLGRIDEGQEIVEGEWFTLECVENPDPGEDLLYGSRMKCSHSGLQGFTVRVVPKHRDLLHPQCLVPVVWAG